MPKDPDGDLVPKGANKRVGDQLDTPTPNKPRVMQRTPPDKGGKSLMLDRLEVKRDKRDRAGSTDSVLSMRSGVSAGSSVSNTVGDVCGGDDRAIGGDSSAAGAVPVVDCWEGPGATLANGSVEIGGKLRVFLSQGANGVSKAAAAYILNCFGEIEAQWLGYAMASERKIGVLEGKVESLKSLLSCGDIRRGGSVTMEATDSIGSSGLQLQGERRGVGSGETLVGRERPSRSRNPAKNSGAFKDPGAVTRDDDTGRVNPKGRRVPTLVEQGGEGNAWSKVGGRNTARKPSFALVVRSGTDTAVTGDEVKNKLLKEVSAGVDVRVRSLRRIRDGVVLEVESEAEREKIKACAGLGVAGLKAEVVAPRGPRVKLYDVAASVTDSDLFLEVWGKNLVGEVDGVDEALFLQSSRVVSRLGPSIVVVETLPAVTELLLKKGRVFVGWNCHRVGRYQEERRCLKCFGFGHRMIECKSVGKLCGVCGNEGHLRADCRKEPHCRNCVSQGLAGRHMLSARDCPLAVEELRKYKNRNGY